MKTLLVGMAFMLTALLAGQANAQTNVYVHGWDPSGADLSWSNNSSVSPYGWRGQLPNAIHVGWNTGEHWASGVPNAVAVLDAQCSRAGTQSCNVVCHSTGCAITGAALDIHGTTNGIPRWRINRVLALASAEGGSELGGTGEMVNAAARLFGYSGPIASSGRYLTPSVVRSAYDHHDTAGTAVFHVAGYDGDLTSALLPGQDDGAVAFHSACGYVKVFSATQCSNDWEWVRKTSFGVPYYVMRTVAQWTNHKRVEYCGRDGCNKTHMQLVEQQFQDLVFAGNP